MRISARSSILRNRAAQDAPPATPPMMITFMSGYSRWGCAVVQSTRGLRWPRRARSVSPGGRRRAPPRRGLRRQLSERRCSSRASPVSHRSNSTMAASGPSSSRMSKAAQPGWVLTDPWTERRTSITAACRSGGGRILTVPMIMKSLHCSIRAGLNPGGRTSPAGRAPARLVRRRWSRLPRTRR